MSKWIVVVAACGAPAPSAPIASHSGTVAVDPLVAVGLPSPPQQHDRWVATVPPKLAAAVAEVFEHGCADPRGLEYREVDLAVADEDARDAITVHTHAWVFERDRFAVAWNGLVYPIKHAGAIASVHEDVERLLAQDRPEHLFWREADAVAVDKPSALKIAILARIGESDAAIALAKNENLGRAFSYAVLDRAIGAHDRDDHATALQFARLVDPKPLDAYDRDVVARLISDEPRKHVPLDRGALAELPAPARITTLVEHLDEIRMYPMESSFSRTDPVFVPEFAKIGEPAIDTLIAVIESDPRFTHTAVESEDHRHLLGVDDAANQAITEILQRSFFDFHGRKQLANEIRTYWAKWRDLSTEERWYAQLADDHADANDQVMAALLITQIDPKRSTFRGEVLRNHAGASVSALLEHRVDAAKEVHDACYIAEAFERWEPGPVAIAAIARVVHRAIAESGTTDRHSYCISDLTTLRAEAGDVAGIDEYAHWIAQTLPEAHVMTLAFTALSTYRTHPSARHAIDVMFRDGSPWVPLVSAKHDESELLSEPMIDVPSFNNQVLAGLADTQPIGTFTMTATNRYFVKLTPGGGVDSVVDPSPLQPPVGTELAVRVCDWVAYQLPHRASKFELYWSVAQRDAAITSISRWVKAQRKP